MEVTSSNSNQFNPKLGQVSKGSLSGESFSSHLAENEPAPRHEPQARSDRDPRGEQDTRDTAAADARADAKATERKRQDAAREREETAEAREADETNQPSDAAEATASTDDTSFDETILEALVEGDTSVADLNQGTTNEETVIAGTNGVAAATNENQTASVGTTDGDSADEALINLESESKATASLASPEEEQGITPVAEKNATAVAQETGNIARNTDAAQATVQQATRPVDLRAANNNQDAPTNQNVGDSETDGEKLLGALDLNTGSEADTDSEPGLGAKTADAMANKEKSATSFEGANNSAKTNAAQAPLQAPLQASAATAPSLPAIPLQTLASLGLSTNGLPAGLDFDQLGLSSAGQSASTPQNNNPVLVRFGVLPGQAQATQVPNTAIALQIAKHVAKGVSTFEIRLDPAELGRVDVKLELSADGRNTAHLVVERPETLDLLQRDAKALEQALRDAGLDTDDTSLQFSLSDENTHQANAQGDDTKDNTSNASTSEPELTRETTRVTALAARQLQAASRGGIDVSI